jgi:hypothetical protein
MLSKFLDYCKRIRIWKYQNRISQHNFTSVLLVLVYLNLLHCYMLLCQGENSNPWCLICVFTFLTLGIQGEAMHF